MIESLELFAKLFLFLCWLVVFALLLMAGISLTTAILNTDFIPGIIAFVFGLLVITLSLFVLIAPFRYDWYNL